MHKFKTSSTTQENEKYHRQKNLEKMKHVCCRQSELVVACFYHKCVDEPSSSMAQKGLNTTNQSTRHRNPDCLVLLAFRPLGMARRPQTLVTMVGFFCVSESDYNAKPCIKFALEKFHQFEKKKITIMRQKAIFGTYFFPTSYSKEVWT